MKIWSVYLLRNERDALYTGVSNDPQRRLDEHRSGLSRSAKYTRACKVLNMVYCCEIGSQGAALRVESRIKKLPKHKKERLVKEKPGRDDLFDLLNYSDTD